MAGEPVLTKEFRELQAKAREIACELGCSKTGEIHLLLALVSDEREYTSRILRAALGERVFQLFIDRLEFQARGREEPVKRSYRDPTWHSAVRSAIFEDEHIYRLGKVYPEHLFLAYLRSQDQFFFRGFFDFFAGSDFIHYLRGQVEGYLRIINSA